MANEFRRWLLLFFARNGRRDEGLLICAERLPKKRAHCFSTAAILRLGSEEGLAAELRVFTTEC